MFIQKVKVKVRSLSRVRLFVTLWTVTHQAPPSIGFSGKSTGVGCHFLLHGHSLKYVTLWVLELGRVAL